MAYSYFFFFNDTATTEIYTLSLHDALPISHGAVLRSHEQPVHGLRRRAGDVPRGDAVHRDRKSTRLNSSHLVISYAVFCLKKKTTTASNMTTLHASYTNLQTYKEPYDSLRD